MALRKGARRPWHLQDRSWQALCGKTGDGANIIGAGTTWQRRVESVVNHRSRCGVSRDHLDRCAMLIPRPARGARAKRRISGTFVCATKRSCVVRNNKIGELLSPLKIICVAPESSSLPHSVLGSDKRREVEHFLVCPCQLILLQ